MNDLTVNKLLKKGRGISTDFKDYGVCTLGEVLKTVCALLNRHGGEILLGVSEKGVVYGIEEQILPKIKADLIAELNNSQNINPVFYLSVDEVKYEEKSVLYIYVPESSQVHRCNGRIFDRNESGDFDITDNTNLISALYLRKQTSYSENKIYPFVRMDDLRSDLMQRVRKLVTLQNKDHVWASMTDEEILKSARLYQRDFQTGKEGFTLAAILLLGKDEVILSVLPHYRTDAVLRKVNKDRYDDRDIVTTNLIESYDRLMAFVEKHLPDPFYLEGTDRISIRSHIFRELIANSLIHREYLNAFPAKLVIEADKIFLENGNKPHSLGSVNLSNTAPFPKNPIIASFFRQINRAEELGSGFKKLARYGRIYFGTEPVIQDKDIFRVEASFPGEAALSLKAEIQTENKLGEKLGEKRYRMLSLINENPNITILQLAGIMSMSTTALENNLKLLKQKGLLKRVGSDKGGHWKVTPEGD